MNKKRECRKGNSCGRTCIAPTKTCRVNLIEPVNKALEKKVTIKAPPGQEEAFSKRMELREKLIGAEVDYDFDGAEKYQKELKDLLKERFEETPDKRKFTPVTRGEPDKELLDFVRENSREDPKGSQAEIYKKMGYNAKPDLVDSRSDLAFNENLLRGEDGLPMVLYRGVSKVEFQDQLRTGDTHFVGEGKVGNGTYSAAPKRQDLDYLASDTANGYGNSKIAFGIKKDAKFFSEGDLSKETEKIAKKYGIDPKNTDTGMLMALGGWDAYVAKEYDAESEFVILNRGAMVISKENITEEWDLE